MEPITAGWWKRVTDGAPRFKSCAGKAIRHPVCYIKKYCKCKGFHEWTVGSVTVVLTRLPMDSDVTDIYLQESLRDYHFNSSTTQPVRHGVILLNTLTIIAHMLLDHFDQKSRLFWILCHELWRSSHNVSLTVTSSVQMLLFYIVGKLPQYKRWCEQGGSWVSCRKTIELLVDYALLTPQHLYYIYTLLYYSALYSTVLSSPSPHLDRVRHIGGPSVKVVAQVDPARQLELHLQADVLARRSQCQVLCEGLQDHQGGLGGGGQTITQRRHGGEKTCQRVWSPLLFYSVCCCPLVYMLNHEYVNTWMLNHEYINTWMLNHEYVKPWIY